MTTEITLAVIVSLVITTAITTTVGILVKKYFDKREIEHKKLLEVEKEERNREIKQIVSDAISPIKDEVNIISKDLVLLKEGNQALLRTKLYNIAEECTKKGFATIEEKQNFENMYKKYHSLGENGVMDNTRAEFLKLPSTKKVTKSKKILNE